MYYYRDSDFLDADQQDDVVDIVSADAEDVAVATPPQHQAKEEEEVEDHATESSSSSTTDKDPQTTKDEEKPRTFDLPSFEQFEAKHADSLAYYSVARSLQEGKDID